jgi:L-seryl-tRNA(Ser) seleniumtransferase
MLLADPAELASRAERVAAELCRSGWKGVSVERAVARVGGGSLPELELPGAAVRIELGEREAGRLAAALRRAEPPVLVRVQRGAVHLDPRALGPDEVAELLSCLAAGPPGPR